MDFSLQYDRGYETLDTAVLMQQLNTFVLFVVTCNLSDLQYPTREIPISHNLNSIC